MAAPGDDGDAAASAASSSSRSGVNDRPLVSLKLFSRGMAAFEMKVEVGYVCGSDKKYKRKVVVCWRRVN